jgi:hypothetical protein
MNINVDLVRRKKDFLRCWKPPPCLKSWGNLNNTNEYEKSDVWTNVPPQQTPGSRAVQRKSMVSFPERCPNPDAQETSGLTTRQETTGPTTSDAQEMTGLTTDYKCVRWLRKLWTTTSRAVQGAQDGREERGQVLLNKTVKIIPQFKYPVAWNMKYIWEL